MTSNPFLELLEPALREYEAKHRQYMNTSVFTPEGKAVKAELKALEHKYLTIRKVWTLWAKWCDALDEHRIMDAIATERRMLALTQQYPQYFPGLVEE